MFVPGRSLALLLSQLLTFVNHIETIT